MPGYRYWQWRGGYPSRFADFTGGVNTLAADYLIGDNQCRNARNVISTGSSALRKRDGCELLAALDTMPHSVYGANVLATRQLLVGCGTDIRSIAADGTVTVLGGGFAGGHLEWAQAPEISEGPVYGMNGTQAFQFNGTTLAPWTASAGTLPIGAYVLFARGRVIVAGVPGSPYSVFTSAIGDPTDWPGNEVQLDPSDGDPITGLSTVGPYVLVFKRRRIYVIYDLDTLANRRLSDNLGCVSHRSAVETPTGTLFLTADRGVYKTDGSRLEPVAVNLSPTLAAMSPAGAPGAAGVTFNDRYYLAIPSSSPANDLVLDLDFKTGGWWLHNLSVNQFATWRPDAGQELYGAMGGDAVHRLFVPGVNQDAGVDFLAFWDGPWLTFGVPEVKKRVRAIHVDGSGALAIYLARSFSAGRNHVADFDLATGQVFGVTGTFGGSSTFGGASTVDARVIYSPGIARAWSMRFESLGNAPFEINSYTFAILRRTT